MKQKSNTKAKYRIRSVLCIAMLLTATLSGCSKGTEKDSNLVFNKMKTQGVVTDVANGKLTITVSQEDSNFKEGDNVVITYQDSYLDKEDSDSDVLEKIESVAVNDHIYVLYGEEECKDNVIKVEYVVKTE